MRRSCAFALLVTFSWIAGVGQDARAGVTIDVQFVDQTMPTGLTLMPGGGPGCTFTGYYHNTVASGRCMDVIMRSTDELVALSASVTYESDNGLAVASFYEWMGVGVSWGVKGYPVPGHYAVKYCVPTDGVTDDGGQVGKFDCEVVPLPAPPGVLSPGTYRIGTIVWDTSAYVWDGSGFSDMIAAYIHGLLAVRNGNVVDISSEAVAGSHFIQMIPEPGAAALLGLGLVGLVIAARRRRG